MSRGGSISFIVRITKSLVEHTRMALFIKLVAYSITSVGLGADPGFLAVSPQVTLVINMVGCHYFPPGPRLYFPSQRDHPLAGTKLYCLVTEAHTLYLHKYRVRSIKQSFLRQASGYFATKWGQSKALPTLRLKLSMQFLHFRWKRCNKFGTALKAFWVNVIPLNRFAAV